MKRLIVTADDFGADRLVNDAIERAHNDGCLTAASLMVTGEAFDDAVRRASALPRLGVGLHLVLVEGKPALPPAAIPDLVDQSGRFRTDMARTGADIFFRPAVRRQVAAEIEAQFTRFAATGLALDHVNAHKHFHLHPTVANVMLEVGARYGMRAVRAPIEPIGTLRQVEPVRHDLTMKLADAWARLLRRRLRRAGLTVPNQVFGVAWSGQMTRARLAGLIDHLPDGVSEIYVHLAMEDRFSGSAPGYRYREEYAALIDPAVRRAIDQAEAKLVRFADLGAPARSSQQRGDAVDAASGEVVLTKL